MEGLSPHETPSDERRRKRRRESTISTNSPRELGQMRTGRDTVSASFVGSGSGIHFVRTVRHAFAQNRPKQTPVNETVEEELIPGEDDRLPAQNPCASLWRLDEISFTSQQQDGALLSVEFDELVRWTRSYFDFWHPPFPFLHAPTVLGFLEKASIDGLAQLSHSETVIVRSIFSISLADRRQMPKENCRLVPSQLLFQSVDDVLSSLQPIISQPSSLVSLQATVAIQIFLISMLRFNAASRIGGFIVKMAQQMGLHRCPTRFGQFSSADMDIRRRLFWSIYCLERYLSQSLGLPLDLKDDDLDVCYPDNELHPSPSARQSNSISAQGSYDRRCLLLPTFLAKHGRIKGMILELRNKSVLHSRTNPDEVAHVDAEISRWWNEAQDLLDSSIDDENGAAGVENPSLLNPSHKLLLLVQKHESVILLNRPVITSGYNTSAFAAAMQKCIGASKSIITHVYRHLYDGVVDGLQERRIRNPLFWPGFCWSLWMSALILLYAASEGHYSVKVAQSNNPDRNREADRCVAILENLSLRGSFWPGACAAAVKELQSALRKQPANSFSLHGAQLSPGRPPEANRAFNEPTSRSTFEYESQYGKHLPTNLNNSGVAVNVNHDSRGPSMVDNESRSNISPPRFLQDVQNVSRGTNIINDGSTSSSYLERSESGDFGVNRMDTGYVVSQQPSGNINSNQHMNLPDGMNIGQGGFTKPDGTGNGEFWQDTSRSYGPANDRFDGFDDVFRLMDVSYLLAGQMLETTQPDPTLDLAYPSIINDPFRYYSQG